MADPVIRSIVWSSQTVAPGGTVTAKIDAFGPDHRSVPVQATVGGATLTGTLSVADPLPVPALVEVDASGKPVTTKTLDIVADPADPFLFHVTARPQ